MENSKTILSACKHETILQQARLLSFSKKHCLHCWLMLRILLSLSGKSSLLSILEMINICTIQALPTSEGSEGEWSDLAVI